MQKRRLICKIFVIVAILTATKPSGFTQSSNETEELIRTASQTAQKTINLTYQAAGVAKVLMYNEAVPAEEIGDKGEGETVLIRPRGPEIEIEERKFLVDFAFRGESSIAEFYEIDETGGKGEFSSAFIYTPEASFYYDKGLGFAVYSPSKNLKEYYRGQGYDFHPQTFTRIMGKPLTEQMEMFIKYAKKIDVDSVDGGLLQIKLEGDKICDYCNASGTLTLASKLNFLPLKYEYDFENKKNGYSLNLDYKAQWEKHSSSCSYITEFESYQVYKEKGQLPARSGIKIEILSLQPDFGVKSSKFDFKNLPIPEGTPVHDNVKHIYYNWGEDTEELKEKIEKGLFD